MVRRVCDREAVQGAELNAAPPELAPFSWLLGTWVGVGTGQYPTIEDFRFAQELSFSNDGRPFLSYWSRSWELDDEGERVRPTATETGFLRPLPDNECELLLSHPTGFAELWHGKVEVTELTANEITGARLTLATDAVIRSPSAKPYTAGQRLYGLVADELLWTFDMAAMEKPLSNHLAARLQRRLAEEPQPDA